MFETFEHTADVGLRVVAATLSELFAEAARGLTAQIVDNPEAIQLTETVTVTKRADQVDYLLFDWLSELIYLYECRQMLFGQFEIVLSGDQLTATARGEPVDRARHRLAHDVKAITYHQFQVRPIAEGYEAQFIIDL